MMSDGKRDRDDDGSVDVEAAWADIVAHWDDAPSGGSSPSGQVPGQKQDLDGDSSPRDADAADGEGTGAAGAPGAAAGRRDELDDWDDEWDVPRSRVGGEGVREAAERDDAIESALDEERYIPPEPPPLPRGDLISRLSWAGVLGAPLFFLFAALFWHSAPTWLVIGAVVAFVAGFTTLVVRMPDREDDGDDGAVV